MKITIPKGIRTEEAAQIIWDLLNQAGEEYGILSSNLTLYVNFEDEFGKRFKDNVREYRYEDGVLVDCLEEVNQKAEEELQEKWNAYYGYTLHQISALESQIEIDKKYLSTAAQKGRSPERVQKRDMQLKENQAKLLWNRNQLELLRKLSQDIRITYFGRSKDEPAAVFIFYNNGTPVRFDGAFRLENGLPQNLGKDTYRRMVEYRMRHKKN